MALTQRGKRKKRTRRLLQRKRQRTTRQRGGAQPTDEQIGRVVHAHVPELHGSVQEGRVRLFCQGPSSDPIYFQITYPAMILHSLKRCPTISGTTLLQRIIAIARALSLHTISLDDASMVGCDFPLYTLSILQHGETWYHRMGFRSDDYEEHKALHDTLRHQPFETFVHTMFREHGPRVSTTYTADDARAYLQQWYRAFPETKGHTAAEVAQMLPWTTIPCDDPRATLLRDFLFMADSALPYEPYVSLDLRQPHVLFHRESA